MATFYQVNVHARTRLRLEDQTSPDHAIPITIELCDSRDLRVVLWISASVKGRRLMGVLPGPGTALTFLEGGSRG